MENKNYYDIRELGVNDIKIEKRIRDENQDHVQDLAVELASDGMLTPIIVREIDGDFRLIDGYHRLAAAKLLEWETIQAVIMDKELDENELDIVLTTLEYVTNEKRKQFSYMEKVEAWVRLHEAFIKKHGDGKKVTGGWTLSQTANYVGEKVSNLSNAFQVAKASEYLPELKEEKNLSTAVKKFKKIKRRDEVQSRAEIIVKKVKAQPENRAKKILIDSFIVGDFFDKVKSVPDNSVDFIECDPPYGIELDSKTKALDSTNLDQYQDIPPEKYPAFLDKLIKELYRTLKPSGWFVFWYGMDPWHDTVLQKLRAVGFKLNGLPLLWTKNIGQTMHPDIYMGNCYETAFYGRKADGLLNKEGRNNVYDYNPIIDRKGDKIHRTMRPIGMMEDLIYTFVGEGANIMVPFAGSGNTLLAASNLNCNAWGYDLSQVHKDEFVIRVHEGKVGEYEDAR